MNDELIDILIDILAIDVIPDDMVDAYWRLSKYMEKEIGLPVEHLINGRI